MGYPPRVPGRFGDPRGGPGRVVRTTGRSGTGRGTLREVRDRLGDLPAIREGLGDPQGGLERAGRPSGRFSLH